MKQTTAVHYLIRQLELIFSYTYIVSVQNITIYKKKKIIIFILLFFYPFVKLYNKTKLTLKKNNTLQM